MNLPQNVLRSKKKNSDAVLQPSAAKRISFPWSFSSCITLLFFFFAGCEKDNEDAINFSTVYDKKWRSASQLADPVWTYPTTGKSYSDLVDFEKDVFPCLRDDYVIFYPDGTTNTFRNTQRCSPDEAEKSPTGTYYFNSTNDSLFIHVPVLVPNQPPSSVTIRSKVLKLTSDEMLIRFQQILPFTNTLHTITWTYRVIP